MQKIVTYSSLSKLAECPAKYNWRINKKLVPLQESKNYIIGRAFHLLISGQRKAAADEILKLKFQDENLYYLWVSRLKIMSEAYELKWPIMPGTLEEVKFAIPLTENQSSKTIKIKIGNKWVEKQVSNVNNKFKNQYFYAGKIDMFDKVNGYLYEIKTISEVQIENAKIAGKKLDKMLLDWQTEFYSYALLKQNIKVNGIVYRIIKKPTIRLKKNEDYKDYEARLREQYIVNMDSFLAKEVLYPYQNYQQTENFLLKLCELLEFYENKNWWPKFYTACNNWSGCQYMPLCTDEENIKYYKIEEPFGELR
jgi:gamma-glutamylcyclotransferase (GGCT)/AIG2-like uncharacterized protein YtfP